MVITFGTCSTEQVRIDIHGYEFEDPKVEPNWLVATIELGFGVLLGAYRATIEVEDLLYFLDSLQALYETLNGEAVFNPIEGALKLNVTGDGLGHMLVTGVANGDIGCLRRIDFEFNIDQTYLKGSIDQLKSVLCAYPER